MHVYGLCLQGAASLMEGHRHVQEQITKCVNGTKVEMYIMEVGVINSGWGVGCLEKSSWRR